MTHQEGWGRRAPRPLYLWIGVAVAVIAGIGLAVFLYRVGNAIATAFERSATEGHSVPDMTGGLPALITAIVGFLSVILPQVLSALTARNRERRDQIARGVNLPPFASSAPAEGGPRPQENIPP